MVHARQQKILELLASKEGMTVGELSKLLEVTEATIRADLNTLSKQGKVSRVHGGAQLIEERVRQEYNFQTRKSLNSARKQKIGKLAAGLVNSYDSILLDSSTTSLALAHLLRRREDLREVTVVACGVWTAIELMGCQNINVLLTGGYLRHTFWFPNWASGEQVLGRSYNPESFPGSFRNLPGKRINGRPFT